MAFEKLKQKNDVYEEMRECSVAELRLWIIQELATVDSECWWLIEDGVELLKEKMLEERKATSKRVFNGKYDD